MDNVELVDILNTANQLMVHSTCLFLRDLFVLDYIVKKLSIFNVFHDQKQLLWCFYNLVQLNDVRVPHQFKNVYLSGHPLHICDI
jgi:hypothetical protein